MVACMKVLLVVCLLATPGCRDRALPDSPVPSQTTRTPQTGDPTHELLLGPMTGLSPTMRRAVSPGPHFPPIPSPEPGDWLAEHHEPGQTYAQFVDYGPNLPDNQRKVIYVLPLGDFPPDQSPPLDLLRRFSEAFFGLDTRMLGAVPLADVKATSRKNGGITQILTRDVLGWLRRRVPRDAYCLIAITMIDLYPEPSWNYVFGQASLKERVGVYSFARYDPAFHGHERGPDAMKTIIGRSLGVMTHELGHMFGMAHCIFFHCLMNGSNHLEESDRAPAHLCPVCLRKLHYVVPSGVVARYRKLRNLYVEVGLEPEAAWYDARVRALAR